MWFLVHSEGVSLMEGDAEVRFQSFTGTFDLNMMMKDASSMVFNLKKPRPKPKPAPAPSTRITTRSEACDALVRKWEGYHRALPDGSCEAYPDVAHGWNVGTIGFGTTRYAVVAGRFGRAEVRQGDTLTRAEAEMELEAEMDKCEKELARVITAPVTQGMFDALISFAYNLGIAGSNVQIDRVNRGEYEQCAAAFDLYVKADGMVLPGLINRRNDEEAMFRKDGMSPGGAAPAPTKPGVLDVPYFSQRDFGGSLAWSICGVTSAAMVLSFWGINMNPDAVLKLHGKAAGQSPAGVEGIFEHHGLKADSTQRGTWEQAFAHIEAGRPVVFNGWFTDAGHILVATGFDGVSVICNDPAGHWEQRNGDSYSDNPKNGKAVRYGLAAFKEAVGKDGDVWFAVAWK